MSVFQAVVIFVAALIGGALNAVAGGGSFLGVPALLYVGVPPVNANATNTLGLWPGSIASSWAYRNELSTQRKTLPLLISTSIAGSVVGAVLLLITPQNTFKAILPYLLLAATLLFAFSGYIVSALRKLRRKELYREADQNSKDDGLDLVRNYNPFFIAVQFATGIYGGYFGGGIGILQLAIFALLGMEDINLMNGFKTLLYTIMSTVAVITFVVAGAIYWEQALIMIAGGIVGGYGGAHYARRIEQRYIRWFVIIFGTVTTIYFFVAYH